MLSLLSLGRAAALAEDTLVQVNEQVSRRSLLKLHFSICIDRLEDSRALLEIDSRLELLEMNSIELPSRSP